MIEALAAEHAEQHDLGRARGDRLRDRELEIGFVLGRREFRDRNALPRHPLDAGIAERVHVADDEVGKELPSFERERAAIGSDDVVLRTDDRTVRRQNITVCDDDGPHGQNKSGA